MSKTTGQRLSRAELSEIAYIVFAKRTSTLDERAASIPLDTLCETMIELTSELLGILAKLPERAFERQPDDAEGNDVWSAGQIVSHLADTTMRAIPFWEAVLSRRLNPPGDAALAAIDAKLLSRADSIAAARDIAASVEALTAALGTAPTLRGPASHFVLGVISGTGALLGTCIHTADHIQQLSDLGDAWPSW